MNEAAVKRTAPSRRRILTVAAALGTGAAVTASAAAGRADAAPAGSLRHPGLLHTEADFARVRAELKAGSEPWIAGWRALAANPHAHSSWRPRPQTVVYRGSGSPENYRILYNDIHAAYQNALRWRITGETAHGDTARDILNAWSARLTSLQGTGDRFLAAGIYGYEFANAAELVRDYPGFDLDRFVTMMRTVFLPLSESFLSDHNGAYVTNYWPNWDLVNTACVLATGILADDRVTAQRAVDYFLHGQGLGSLRNAIPVVYDDGLAEWLEAGRDQGHATLGVGIMAAICEMAWSQGLDLYGHDDNRFLKGAEYVAKWNLGHDVPFTPFTWNAGAPHVWAAHRTFTAASPDARGTVRPIWTMIENHYVQRRGLPAPYVTAMAAKVGVEGGGGDYGPNSGGYDQLGFGTLMFTRRRSRRQAPGLTPRPGGPATSFAGDAASAKQDPNTTRRGALASTGSPGALLYGGLGGAAVALAGGLLALRRRRGSDTTV